MYLTLRKWDQLFSTLFFFAPFSRIVLSLGLSRISHNVNEIRKNSAAFCPCSILTSDNCKSNESQRRKKGYKINLRNEHLFLFQIVVVVVVVATPTHIFRTLAAKNHANEKKCSLQLPRVRNHCQSVRTHFHCPFAAVSTFLV